MYLIRNKTYVLVLTLFNYFAPLCVINISITKGLSDIIPVFKITINIMLGPKERIRKYMYLQYFLICLKIPNWQPIWNTSGYRVLGPAGHCTSLFQRSSDCYIFLIWFVINIFTHRSFCRARWEYWLQMIWSRHTNSWHLLAPLAIHR